MPTPSKAGAAPETRGNVYEAIVHVALEGMLRVGEQVWWHRPPVGVSRQTDLTVGTDPDRPRLVVLVTHTRAQRASEKKFWRNVGELAELRDVLEPTAQVIEVELEAGRKPRLATASRALFDGTVTSDDPAWGPALLSLGAEVADRGRALRGEGRLEIVRRLVDTSPVAAAAIAGLRAAIDAAVTRPPTWPRLPERPAPRLARPQPSLLRRGVGHLLPVADEADLRRIASSTRRGATTDLPGWFAAAGLSTPTLLGEQITDPGILDAIRQLDDDALVAVWRRSREGSVALRQACDEIAAHDDFDDMWQGFVDRWPRLVDPDALATELAAEFAQRHPAGVPTFRLIMSVLKHAGRRHQSFGYSTLDRAAGTGLGTAIGPHLSRFASGERPLEAELLSAFSTVLARRLGEVGAGWARRVRSQVGRTVLRSLFEDRIHTSSKLDPIRFLIEEACPSLRLQPRFATAVTDLAGTNVGTCQVLTDGQHVVLWQSVTASHNNDKTAELCGRLAMLRRTSRDGVLALRPVWEVLLVLDGEWRQHHLERLARAGADGIYLPAEVHTLAAHIG